MSVMASFLFIVSSVLINISANTAAIAVKTPTIDSRNRLSVTGWISAVIPVMIVASTTTTPSRSPIASEECPFLMLCSENVNSGSVVPSAISTSPIIIAGIPMLMASVWLLVTIAVAAASISAALSMNIRVFLIKWLPSLYDLWKYSLSDRRTIMNVIPLMSSIAASILPSVPSSPSMIGSVVSPTKYMSFLIMLLWTVSGCPARATNPRMSVRSAMLLPSRVPIPMLGSPLIAAIMLMNVSGSADTSATMIKLVTNSVIRNDLAMCAIDLTA